VLLRVVESDIQGTVPREQMSGVESVQIGTAFVPHLVLSPAL